MNFHVHSKTSFGGGTLTVYTTSINDIPPDMLEAIEDRVQKRMEAERDVQDLVNAPDLPHWVGSVLFFAFGFLAGIGFIGALINLPKG